MRHNIHIRLAIRCESKWHAGSGEGSLMLDRLIRKDARNWPYIPGSTLKGVVRENCEKLSRTLEYPEPLDPHSADIAAFQPLCELASPVDRLFGNKYESGRLFFRDARPAEKPGHLSLKQQSRIRKYRMLGTAKDRHLFSSEYAAPMELHTEIDGYHDALSQLEEGDPPYAYCLLVASVLMLDRIGGDKSTGSGRVGVILESVEYNGNPLAAETVFDYLDSELYQMNRQEDDK